MQKADKLDHAAKVVAMCVPPVVLARVGLLLQTGHARYQGQGGSAGIARDRRYSSPLPLAIAKAAVAHVAVARSLT
jgi:hypothetical protein